MKEDTKLESFNLERRGFKKVSNANVNTKLPTRSDKYSAGYDFYLNKDVIIKPKEQIVISTGIKAFMMPDEVLILQVRSSIGIKKNLMLSNSLGIIDSSFYNNPANEGNIQCVLYNYGDKTQELKAGDRIVQGIFMKYLIADNDIFANTERIGGIGSSGN